MVSESSVNDLSTPNAKQPPRLPTPPVSQLPTEPTSDEAASAQPDQGPQGEQFFFNEEPPHDGTAAENGGTLPVPFPAMPMFPYPASGPIARPKRTQCKNACTNCQKACKKCDDNRPCHRCIRYGTTETCVDSKRKERKKGVKRGPYKKRDSKNHNADAEHEDGSGAGSTNSMHGPSPMPYVGPVGYPPGMWGTYSPGGPVAKIEGGGYYQPVFALTPIAGQGHHPSEGESAGGGGEGPSHFPVGFYPATLISYPGPYAPYHISPLGQGAPHGFHYAYPPPPGVIYPSRPLNMATSSTNGEQSACVPGSTDPQNKNSPDSKVTDVASKGDSKDGVVEPQVNGKSKLPGTVKGAVAEEHE